MSNSAQRLMACMDKLSQAKSPDVNRALYDLTEKNDSKEKVNIRAAKNLVLLYDLYNEVIEDVKTIPGMEHSLFLRWTPGFLEALQSLDASQAKNFPTVLKARYRAEKTMLEVCAHELSRRLPKTVFSEDDRMNLYNQASELQKNVMASKELDPQIKKFIFDKLEAILSAIAFYDFTGDKGIIKAAENATGASVHKTTLCKLKKDKSLTVFDNLKEVKDWNDFRIFLFGIIEKAVVINEAYEIVQGAVDKFLTQ